MGRNGLIIGAIVIVALAAGGYFYLNKSQTKAPSQDPNTNQSQTGNVFTSIKDALSKSLSLQCDFTEDGRKTVSYIKNGRIRADIASSNTNESGHVVIKDKTMYFWQDGKNEGFMMTFSDQDVDNAQKTAGQATNPGDVMDMLERFKDSCKASAVSDSLFDQPSNVTFQDFSKLMQQGSQSPSGAPTIDPKKVEELMKQYKQ